MLSAVKQKQSSRNPAGRSSQRSLGFVQFYRHISFIHWVEDMVSNHKPPPWNAKKIKPCNSMQSLNSIHVASILFIVFIGFYSTRYFVFLNAACDTNILPSLCVSAKTSQSLHLRVVDMRTSWRSVANKTKRGRHYSRLSELLFFFFNVKINK